MAPLGPTMRMPEALMEVRNMLVTRMEQWMERWKEQSTEQLKEHLKEQWLQEGEQRGEQRGLQQGRQLGRQQGEATLLLRQLERRFGDLPGWVTDRVLAADSVLLEKWSLLVLDALSLEEVLA